MYCGREGNNNTWRKEKKHLYVLYVPWAGGGKPMNKKCMEIGN